jgi:hypothetical protein
MRRLRLVLLAAIGLSAGYIVSLSSLALQSGLTWHEMDADRDGATSVGEFLNAADVGRRPVVLDGRPCTEIYYLKDGRRAKVVCPAA